MKMRNEYKIQGMTCDACARRIEKKINKIDGVRAQVSFATESAIIEFNDKKTLEQISNTLREMGYILVQEDSEKEKVSYLFLGISLFCTFVLLVPMFLMFFGIHFHIPPVFQMLLALVVILSIGKNFFKSAVYTILDKSTNMDVLVSLGSFSAFLLSVIHWILGQTDLYFESTAAILSFVGLGKYLEKKAKHKTMDLFQKLVESLPKEALVFRENSWVSIPVKEIQVGDKIKVLAGEKIPCDSKIVEGQANIEESIFTGESLPVLKQKDNIVLAGSLCLDGVLILEVVSTTSKLEKSFYLLQQAIASKPRIQVLVDKVSSIFVPFVLLVSFITLCAWGFMTNDWTKAILYAISVLVISCPCALGLATPTALLVGNSLALKNGILFKNSETLENIEKLEILFWDKTGTLTKGKPNVIHESNPNLTLGEKEILLALVQSSFHPFSKAIQNYYNVQTNLQLQNIQIISGVGIKANFQNEEYALVSEKYLLENKITYPIIDSKYAVSFFIKGKQILSIFYFTDELKPEAKTVIQILDQMGIESQILSGDRIEVVEQIAKILGIKTYLGRLTPKEKKEEIEKYKLKGKKVGMVGDGINDVHALINADLSFSLNTGTEIAKEAADITLIKEDLLLLPKSIQLGKKIINKIKQNLWYAFIYNAFCIPLAAFGYLNPVIAGLAMSMSSVSVIINSLLLKQTSRKHI